NIIEVIKIFIFLIKFIINPRLLIHPVDDGPSTFRVVGADQIVHAMLPCHTEILDNEHFICMQVIHFIVNFGMGEKGYNCSNTISLSSSGMMNSSTLEPSVKYMGCVGYGSFSSR